MSVLLWLAVPLCLAANPFYTKFGEPSRDADPGFVQKTRAYGSLWRSTFAVLGKGAMDDKKAFDEWILATLNPELDKLVPKTPEEKKMKEAAVWVRDLVSHRVHPDAFSPELRKEMDTFLNQCGLPDQPDKTMDDKLCSMILSYGFYTNGLNDAQAKQLLEKAAEEGKKQTKPPAENTGIPAGKQD